MCLDFAKPAHPPAQVAAPHLAVESTAYSMNTAAQINYKTKPSGLWV